MEADYGSGPDASEQEAGRWVALAREYRAAAPEQRERVRSAIVAAMGDAGRAEARERLLTWITDTPESDLATSADYRRFRDLLPEALAGRLPPTSPEHTWFHAYLERCPACREEFEELRAAFEAEDGAILSGVEDEEDGGPVNLRQIFGDPRKAVEDDIFFLPRVAESAASYDPQPGPAARAFAIWNTGLRATIHSQLRGAYTMISLALDQSAAGQRPGLDKVSGKGQWLTLSTARLTAVSGQGMVLVTAQLRKEDDLNCRLRVRLSGRGLRGRSAGIEVGLRHPGAASESLATDQAGTAELSLPIEQLPGLLITIELPLDIAADFTADA